MLAALAAGNLNNKSLFLKATYLRETALESQGK